MAVYVNFQLFMNITINSHRNPYFEEAFVAVGPCDMTDTETPCSLASKKVKENMAMVWLVSLFLIGNPSYCFLKEAY